MIERVQTFDFLEKYTRDILSLIKPTKDDQNKRLCAIQEIVNSIYLNAALGDAAVKPFGSFVSNLYAKSGDLDVSIEMSDDSNFHTRKRRKQNILKEVMKALQVRGVARDVRFVPTARVPVLQYVSNHFGISCDISVDNYPGRIKSRALYWINTLDGRFGDMVLLVKEWAKAQNINDPKNGTLNSYSFCLLVLFHFQTCEPAILPPVKEIYDVNIAEDIAEMGFYNEKHLDEVCAANIAKFQRRNEGHRNQSSLAYLLTTFFLKFSNLRAHSNNVISTYTGRHRLKQIQDTPYWRDESYCLFVEDPFERPDNAARTVGTQELQRIASAFNSAYVICQYSAPGNENELRSLLCTSEVGSKLGGRAAASSYTNPGLMHQPNRLIGYLERVADNPYNNQSHEIAGGSSGSRSFHSSKGYNSGRQAAAPYQSQQRGQKHTSDRQANRYDVATSYKPVVDGPTMLHHLTQDLKPPQAVQHGHGSKSTA